MGALVALVYFLIGMIFCGLWVQAEENVEKEHKRKEIYENFFRDRG